MAAPRRNPPAGALQTIEAMAAEGHSIIGIAKHLGVSKRTFKRWCDDDDAFQDAFEIGRDKHRQYLVSLVLEAAKANKGANANAMFLLKTMHGFREFDSPQSKVDVNVNQAQPVLVIRDFGTNEEWAARALEQQQRLTAPEAIKSLPIMKNEEVPSWIEANTSEAEATAVQTPTFEAPVWRGNA